MDESYISGYDDGVSDCDFEWKKDYEKLEQQLKECRKHLTESVARECKCKANVSVNNDLVNRNLKLRQQLKEATAEIKELYSGRLGACHTCEQVAELNIKLENQLKEANGKKDR